MFGMILQNASILILPKNTRNLCEISRSSSLSVGCNLQLFYSNFKGKFESLLYLHISLYFPNSSSHKFHLKSPFGVLLTLNSALRNSYSPYLITPTGYIQNFFSSPRRTTSISFIYRNAHITFYQHATRPMGARFVILLKLLKSLRFPRTYLLVVFCRGIILEFDNNNNNKTIIISIIIN